MHQEIDGFLEGMRGSKRLVRFFILAESLEEAENEERKKGTMKEGKTNGNMRMKYKEKRIYKEE